MQFLDLRKVLIAVLSLMMPMLTTGVAAQESIEWFTLGSDYAHTRYSPAAEITADNFEDLEVAWEWDGASFGAASGRSTPSYIDGMLYTVAGYNRHVVAIDPKTGETQWSFRLPDTPRQEYSMRADYGKGGWPRSFSRSTTPVSGKPSTGTGVPQSSSGKPVLASSATRKKPGVTI